jgi:hypothetical protein
LINAGAGELPEGTVSAVTEAFVAAACLPQTGRDQAARIGQAEGQATVALLRALGDGVAYLRTLSGRGDDVALDLLAGQATALTPIRQARVAF